MSRSLAPRAGGLQGARRVLRVLRVLGALGALGVLGPGARGAAAQGTAPPDDTTAREEAMFGAPETTETTETTETAAPGATGDGGDAATPTPAIDPAQPPTPVGGPVDTPVSTDASDDRDARLLGADAAVIDQEARLDDALSEQQDTLTIGGFAYLRLDYRGARDASFSEHRVGGPSLFDGYLDGRPNDDVRLYVRGRVRHDFSVAEGDTDAFGQPLDATTAQLDQLWLKLNAARSVFITAGRQPVRWGTGRFWNPTDFLNRQVRQPLDLFDERTGIGLLKVHVPVEAWGWNLYAVANFEGADRPRELAGAVRGEFVLGPGELSLSYADGAEVPTQLGFDLSLGVWLLDFRVEVAAQHGVEQPVYRGPLDIAAGVLPRADSRAEDWVLQGVGGVELGVRYSDDDSIYFGAEYFYNGLGYGSARLYPWLLAQGAFTPLYLGEHYGAVYAMLPAPGSWNDTTFTLSGLSNLSDESILTRLDYRVVVLTYLNFNVYGAYHFGRNGEFRYGLDIPPLPAEGLMDGVVVPAPLFEVGLGLQLRV